jgi:hypothetical protein
LDAFENKYQPNITKGIDTSTTKVISQPFTNAIVTPVTNIEMSSKRIGIF